MTADERESLGVLSNAMRLALLAIRSTVAPSFPNAYATLGLINDELADLSAGKESTT